jgi:hypothetical protein
VSTQLFQNGKTSPRYPLAQTVGLQAGWIQLAPVYAFAQPGLIQVLRSYVLAGAGWIQAGLAQAAFSPPPYVLAQAGLAQIGLAQAEGASGWTAQKKWTQQGSTSPAYRLAQTDLAQSGLTQQEL